MLLSLKINILNVRNDSDCTGCLYSIGILVYTDIEIGDHSRNERYMCI